MTEMTKIPQPEIEAYHAGYQAGYENGKRDAVRHGKWKEIIDEKEDLFFRQKFYCSACVEWNTYGMTAYCPKCGAKMDGLPEPPEVEG